MNLVADAQSTLVDPLAVHERSRLVAEVDQDDVIDTARLHDRVHTRGKLVVDANVRLGVFANLDDVLGDRLATNGFAVFEPGEGERHRLLNRVHRA